MHAVHGECNNYIFTLLDPTSCDKKSRSEHQTLFSLFGSGHETILTGSVRLVL